MPTVDAPISLALPVDRTGHQWGGRLCLAVVNSVLWRRSDNPDELLTDYPALVRHVGLAGALSAGERDLLVEAAAADPAAALCALTAAIALRELLFEVFSSVAAGAVVPTSQWAALNVELAPALAHLRLVPTTDGPGGAVGAVGSMGWPDEADLDLPRRQIAASAAAVLTTVEPARLKQCPGERCGWVFLDTSRNRSRRWCEPNECGNRERVRAHYRRSRSGA